MKKPVSKKAIEMQKKSILTFLSKGRHYHLDKNYKKRLSPRFVLALDELQREGKILKTTIHAYGKSVWISAT